MTVCLFLTDSITFHYATSRTELLFLAKADRQHRCKSGDTVTFRLQVAQFVQHKTRFVKPTYPSFRRTLTPAFTSSGSRLSLCKILHPALGAVAQPPPYWPYGHSRYTFLHEKSCKFRTVLPAIHDTSWTVGSLSQLLRRRNTPVLLPSPCKA